MEHSAVALPFLNTSRGLVDCMLPCNGPQGCTTASHPHPPPLHHVPGQTPATHPVRPPPAAAVPAPWGWPPPAQTGAAAAAGRASRRGWPPARLAPARYEQQQRSIIPALKMPLNWVTWWPQSVIAGCPVRRLPRTRTQLLKLARCWYSSNRRSGVRRTRGSWRR